MQTYPVSWQQYGTLNSSSTVNTGSVTYPNIGNWKVVMNGVYEDQETSNKKKQEVPGMSKSEMANRIYGLLDVIQSARV